MNEIYYMVLLLMLLTGFLSMLICELCQRSSPLHYMVFKAKRKCLSGDKKHFMRTVLWRYAALMLPWLLMNIIIQQHYYFLDTAFVFTRFAFANIAWLVAFLGVPYITVTLYLRGDAKYEFNDYAVLTLLLCRALMFRLMGKSSDQSLHVLRNRRSKKLFLSWLVTLFFLTLMFRFLNVELGGFRDALAVIREDSFSHLSFFQQYHAVYLFFFHFIFVIDVGIAVVAYAVANRWLDNRVRSVDPTLKGWVFALICYPPLNSGFTGQFFGYDRFPTQQVVSSEWVLMILMALILTCFFIYVWSTVSLGFKFSNLCHRGLVTSGPYKYLRHPAYTTKNIAWWLDYTYVFSNGWAFLAMVVASLIYIMRGVTEEKHLSHDPAYLAYCNKVQGRFWPDMAKNKN
ncbi:MAG: methyltransferase [Mariprofundaceae bacterium]|nr:methyltransferase [Mariprofundaceae bacterium]